MYTSSETVSLNFEAVKNPNDILNSLHLHCVRPNKSQQNVMMHLNFMQWNVPDKQILRVIKDDILTEIGKKKDVFITRIRIIPTDLPFKCK